MTAPAGIDQELVVHMFLPLDGPRADTAWAQAQGVWTQARGQLRVTEIVPAAGAREVLPDNRIPVGRDRVVACAQNRGADFQIIARRFHDILNLSLVFGAPLDRVGRRRRTSVTPGWHEFERWWRALSFEGVDAVLGLVVVLLAETDVVDDLPQRLEELFPSSESSWGPRLGPDPTNWAVWEAHSPSDSARRILFVAGAQPYYDNELTTWTWSDGGAELPVLARYLMHATKLRYQHRLLDASADKIRALTTQARAHVDAVRPLLHTPDGREGHSLATALSIVEEDLSKTVSDLKAMDHTAEIAYANMTRCMTKPFPHDEVLAIGLRERIHDDSYYLQNTLDLVRESRKRLRDVNQVDGGAPPVRQSMLSVEPDEPNGRLPRGVSQMRFGFGLDIVGYGQLLEPGAREAQGRLAGVIEQILANLGYVIADTERELRGDQVITLLPTDADIPTALAVLISAMRSRLAADNRKFAKRMRLRAVASIRVFSRGEIGLAAGATEIGRLLESDPVYRALAENPESDVVLLISERLHEDTVALGYEQLLPFRFEQCRVRLKEYDKTAWLWIDEQ
ncbi:CATRA conflict system CASPASE/TPR repeat-associated protein [Nocardia sp. NPDC052566]|uniref:CATRA conflict system CASPASE/TPR repeat-associated protein n=1 Tax=Nocardia sp. NPDC052566 TaxID=3364330 RepID=UPI0037C74CA3